MLKNVKLLPKLTKQKRNKGTEIIISFKQRREDVKMQPFCGRKGKAKGFPKIL